MRCVNCASIALLIALLSRLHQTLADETRPTGNTGSGDARKQLASTPSAAPRVPAFERFHSGGADALRGGQLLLGELGCTNCHTADKALDGYVQPKQAPILDAVGARVRPGHLRALLSNPHAAKPGTTMPDLLAGKSDAERGEAAEALLHFLASTGRPPQAGSERKYQANGGKLYHQIGCVACHEPRGVEETPLATSLPLGHLAEKYTIPSLAAFLQNPLAVRPSGRMPSLNLKPEEARDLAHYLLPEVRANVQTNLAYRYYEGQWDQLPKFDQLKPKAQGKSAGFDVGVAERENDFALVFEGYLNLGRAGDYTFYVTSDDGGMLWLDGEVAVDNDGIHAPQTVSRRMTMTKGVHPLKAAVFNAGGGVELTIEYEGPGLPRQPLSYAVYPTIEAITAPPPPTPEKPADEDVLEVNPALAAKGRELFATLGCASCHQLTLDKARIASKLSAPPLAKLNASAGCLAEKTAKGVPHYSLNAPQRAALVSAVQMGGSAAASALAKLSPQETIARTLATFNCYACHERDKVGGVEPERNRYFETTQKEMGDEGRIPPPLDGVGAKLTASWMKQLFANGAQDRPYMLTRMPKFGGANLDRLVPALEAADTLAPVAAVEFSQPLKRVKADGRHLVGNQALGCIKCHNFKNEKATGIQAMNMTAMTQRLKHDWFHRYMLNPQEFRPGTRMPAAWPNGQTFYKDLLEGSVAGQIEAVWLYLADGDKAQVPYGLGRQPIPLVADKEPVIYRNFIQGAGPRGIAVGYPEKANLAFDAAQLRLAMIWQGAFIDASKHWLDRGAGFQSPLGDYIVNLPAGPGFALLDKPDAPWPAHAAKEQGYQFQGYRLDSQRRPVFLYSLDKARIEDFPAAFVGPNAPELKRTLTVSADTAIEGVYFRAAVANKIEPAGDGWYAIDGEWKLKIDSPLEPILRAAGNQRELVVPIKLDGRKPASIVEHFAW